MADNPLGQMSAGLDTAKVAGLMVVASLLILGGLRKGFAGVRVHVGS